MGASLRLAQQLVRIGQKRSAARRSEYPPRVGRGAQSPEPSKTVACGSWSLIAVAEKSSQDVRSRGWRFAVLGGSTARMRLGRIALPWSRRWAACRQGRTSSLIGWYMGVGGCPPDESRRKVLAILRELTPTAPLHNGPALQGIEATQGGGVPLVAALDSAFHDTMPARSTRYAIPEVPGVRRYGFHGWSHRSVREQYAALSGSATPTIISLHLGSGCSAAAIRRVAPSIFDGILSPGGVGHGDPPGDLDSGYCFISYDKAARSMTSNGC